MHSPRSDMPAREKKSLNQWLWVKWRMFTVLFLRLMYLLYIILKTKPSFLKANRWEEGGERVRPVPWAYYIINLQWVKMYEHKNN